MKSAAIVTKKCLHNMAPKWKIQHWTMGFLGFIVACQGLEALCGSWIVKKHLWLKSHKVRHNLLSLQGGAPGYVDYKTI